MPSPPTPFPGDNVDRWTAVGLLALSLWVHLSGMLAAEFTGEDEMLFAVIARAFIAGLSGDGAQLMRAFTFYYPPLQALLPAPLIGLFGLHPWTLRLPGALAGAATAPLLYMLMRRHGCRRHAALLAGFLAAAGSVAANHYYALTCGLFAGFALIGAWGLADFLNAREADDEHRSLLIGAVGITAAMMTLQDGIFYLPVLAAAYLGKRGLRFPRGAWPAVGLVGLWVTAFLVGWILLPALMTGGEAGGSFKLRTALSQLGAWRLRELWLSLIAGSSWPAVILSLALFVPGWRALRRPLRWVVIYYTIPLAFWTFLFDYPNVRSAHMLLAFPAFALLWGAGAASIAQRLSARAPRLVPWWRGLILGVCLTVLWQTLALHVTARIPPPARRILVLRGFYPQGRWVERFGQESVGRWIRENTPPDVAVICNLGGAFGDYYAHRPIHGLSELRRYRDDPIAAEEAGVRYYAHFIAGPMPDGIDVSALPMAMTYTRDGRIIAHVYDLWRSSTTTEIVQ